MPKPAIIDDPAFRALRSGNLDDYHASIDARERVDFSGADLRGTDLREADLQKVNLRNAYLRHADIRGQDLRRVNLEGASIHNAKISGVFFPPNIAAEEIRLSWEFGTRLRLMPTPEPKKSSNRSR